jgi:putative radical SAM enzyme (TIGR03279 family)
VLKKYDLGGFWLKRKKVTVYNVLPSSIAQEAGIERGDVILSINSENIGDVFDYRFLTANEELLLEIEKPDGEIWEIEVEKEQYDDLGIEFEDDLIDKAKSCTNNCIFCFIDQLPKGMRETLYFKDDDSRLSFLTGNYVTLTNMSILDIDRIIKYKMTPINVSVHTTNPELRVSMLNNRFAGDVLDKIKRLADGGISVNCQIVLCRDVNDGNELDRTISDLAGLYPGVKSISVVPVGITRHREGLYALKPFDRQSSEEVISQVAGWQDRYYSEYGSRIVYLADEFYIMAEQNIPGFLHYEDFPQIENGVGLLACLKHEFDVYLKELNDNAQGWIPPEDGRNVSIATGVSAYRYVKEMAKTLEKVFEGLKVDVYEIKNEFFGQHVTVAGLLTGQDLAGQLEGMKLGDELLIPRSMLRAGEEVFLDDYLLSVLEQRLNVKITVADNTGRDFINCVLGIKH